MAVKIMGALIVACLVSVVPTLSVAQVLITTGIKMQVDLQRGQEMFWVKVDDAWQPALATGADVYVGTSAGIHACAITSATSTENGLRVGGDCGVGVFEQRFSRTSKSDVLDVSTRLMLSKEEAVSSVEDRYDFLPELHRTVDEHTGPLDFVWSQDIKRESDDLIPANSFKSPAIMMQQGRIFAALVPQLNEHHAVTPALDLDVTSGAHPWMACGEISSEPHDHSYFRRAREGNIVPLGHTIEYRYSIVLSDQPPRQGYRRIVRLLWEQFGHPALLVSADEQRNVLRPELNSFETWRKEAWQTYADRVYMSFPCADRSCGTLRSDRNYQGHWDHPEPDAWFNAWFQTLRTAYGWYLDGRATHDQQKMDKAESVLNLALSSPQKQGAFSTIYLVDRQQWVPGDGWANYADSYQAFSMSWTAYWMLRWAEDLVPARKAEILRFVKPYGDFLLAHQEPSGVIPSWYNAATLEPRTEFRDFNAETAPSALFLTALGEETGDQRYVKAAELAMSFIEREVVPRQRWFDFETYLSCARKDFSFFDQWTAQYPQNNLAEIQAPAAMLALYRATHKIEYLDEGVKMLDYLLLTQQVWNNPLFTPKLLGGFTTQNTDQEWSDARQSYAAMVIEDYYEATGTFEYLERAIAAARSTFAVAPWENWAHTGYMDQPGALTGFHWGTGSAMTSVELLWPKLGDALIDVHARQGAGFDECSIEDVDVQEDAISFRLSSPALERSFRVRFKGLDAGRQYRVRWNDETFHTYSGKQLLEDGVAVRARD